MRIIEERGKGEETYGRTHQVLPSHQAAVDLLRISKDDDRVGKEFPEQPIVIGAFVAGTGLQGMGLTDEEELFAMVDCHIGQDTKLDLSPKASGDSLAPIGDGLDTRREVAAFARGVCRGVNNNTIPDTNLSTMAKEERISGTKKWDKVG